MKIKKGYILKQIGNQHIVVPVGEEAINFNGLINLNESGVMLFQALLEEKTIEALIEILKNRYEIDDQTAKEDIISFIRILESKKIIE
jgi:hypothetical protein